MWRFKLVIIGLLFCLGALFLFIPSPVQTGAPAITFLGLTKIPTNGIIGGTSQNFPALNLETLGLKRLVDSDQVGLFMISNSLGRPIFWNYSGSAVQTDSGWQDRGIGNYSIAFTLNPGESQIFPLPEADPLLPWRISVSWHVPLGPPRSIANYFALRLAKRDLFPVNLYEIHSPTVEKGAVR